MWFLYKYLQYNKILSNERVALKDGIYPQVFQVSETGERTAPQSPDVVVVEQQRVESPESTHALGGNVADLVEPKVPEM